MDGTKCNGNTREREKEITGKQTVSRMAYTGHMTEEVKVAVSKLVSELEAVADKVSLKPYAKDRIIVAVRPRNLETENRLTSRWNPGETPSVA